jgi:hypothetical protein
VRQRWTQFDACCARAVEQARDKRPGRCEVFHAPDPTTIVATCGIAEHSHARLYQLLGHLGRVGADDLSVASKICPRDRGRRRIDLHCNHLETGSSKGHGI